jgi:spermidine synthase
MAHWKEFSKRRGEKISYEITRTLLEGRTAYQEVGIYDTVSNGRALFLDGKIQSAETDEFIYHEALVQPALICHPNPRRVYIAGGGEGATLREVLRHKSVESAVMVDLDGEVCAAAKQHLGIWHAGAYDDPRTTLLHQDARAWLVDSSEPFDSVIVDVTDPLAGGPSYMLFTKEFTRSFTITSHRAEPSRSRPFHPVYKKLFSSSRAFASPISSLNSGNSTIRSRQTAVVSASFRAVNVSDTAFVTAYSVDTG